MNIRLIHISTDCIFSGKKGFYDEEDYPDSLDLYGRTKFLGELSNSNAITLRTSFIGKELSTNYGLLNWFLSQEGIIKGFSKAYILVCQHVNWEELLKIMFFQIKVLKAYTMFLLIQ